MNFDKLTKKEKLLARRLNVTSEDLHRSGVNSFGTVWGLYNEYYLIQATFNGYTQPQIYRALLRCLFDRLGVQRG